MTPRFTSAQLFENLLRFCQSGGHFHSLVRKNKYRLTRADPKTRTYDVRYESGKTRTIPFDDLYAIYTEVYRIGRMSRTYLREGRNCERIVGHDKYTQVPGATIYAILPCLDELIQIEEGGNLRVLPPVGRLSA
jgi:hypothetical protein